MTLRSVALSAAAAIALYAIPASAQFTHGAPEDFNDHDGFTSLFDGKTLNGWDGDPSLWSVKDGSIYINPSCEHPTGTVYIVWQGGEVGDFDLKLEMKGTGSINSGIQYRSWITPAPNPPRTPAPGGGRAGGGGGRAAASATCPSGQPRGTQPTRESQSKWDMSGYQYDFDNNGQYPGQLYEQSTGRGIIAWMGEVVETREGRPKQLLATLADQPTVKSWFKKDDWNTEEILASGNTLSHFLNGHLMSVTIDNERSRATAKGKIGIEVESTGEIFVKNIWLKKY